MLDSTDVLTDLSNKLLSSCEKQTDSICGGFQSDSRDLLFFFFNITTLEFSIHFCNNSAEEKYALKGNHLTTNKDSHNDETVFYPSQNDRLDINPGCFMNMPFICPSNMRILSELTENKENEL